MGRRREVLDSKSETQGFVECASDGDPAQSARGARIPGAGWSPARQTPGLQCATPTNWTSHGPIGSSARPLPCRPRPAHLHPQHRLLLRQVDRPGTALCPLDESCGLGWRPDHHGEFRSHWPSDDRRTYALGLRFVQNQWSPMAEPLYSFITTVFASANDPHKPASFDALQSRAKIPDDQWALLLDYCAQVFISWEHSIVPMVQWPIMIVSFAGTLEPLQLQVLWCHQVRPTLSALGL